ncbi:unnamed protein product [Phytophthora fragariaefolia]|uniref:Unnamed protein product n=1 Tax=Phytophthora fragariaefolia TaxID=1490495 RepID=A0A9W6XYH3_9STRA|nr:unnamed protein product [Phytophthora fragariaefolia]
MEDSSESEQESSGSEAEDHVRQVYLAAANESKASSSAHQSRQDTERSKVNTPTDAIDNTCELKPTSAVASLRRIDELSRSDTGCHIDESQKQECIGIGESMYTTVGRTRIKVTLAGSLVYYFDAWVGPQSGQTAILGMDFMGPAGIRLDLADGSLCLPDEVKIQLSGRRQLYSANSQLITLDQHLEVPVAGAIEVPIRSGPSPNSKLWVTRGPSWVPTVVKGLGRTRYLRLTNVSEAKVILQRDVKLGIWLAPDAVPRLQGFVSVGSHRHSEWQNLAFEATTDLQQAPTDTEQPADPMIERPQYSIPTKIAKRPALDPKPVVSAIARRGVLSTEKPQETVKEELLQDRDAGSPTGMFSEPAIPFTRPDHPIDMAPTRDPTVATSEPPVTLKSKVAEEEQICYHEGGDLFAEDVEQHMALLPEVVSTTDEVTIEDIQAGDPEFNTPEEIDRLRRIIWRRKHLLIGKGNALSPAALGAVFPREAFAADQRVAVCKDHPTVNFALGIPDRDHHQEGRVDIRLCIDYRLVNSLTRLMVYTMPLINDLLEDLDKVRWYCSLDITSGFWVVTMTPRAREISAFITPFGLFEWLRMPFGLKNAPQIYQRLVDNALYGHLKISANSDPALPIDVFKDGEPETDQKPSVLGRRSYIDDILVTATDWDVLCEKVEKLLEACDRWNLSISVVKSFWGLCKVDYLGHRVSADGLEAHPKDLESLANLPFPRTLRSMQSFLGSLNYYSRFIEDFAIYAAVLYELRETDFHEIRVKEEIKPVPDPQLIGDGRSIASTPILRHFDPDRAPVVVDYASKWAISASLMQEHGRVYWPVMFTSRTLKSNEINYGIVDKEVLALLRILDVCYTLLVTRSIKVLTRHPTLAWLLHTSGFNGRLG